jgi:hypothetical protein
MSHKCLKLVELSQAGTHWLKRVGENRMVGYNG